MNDTPIVTPKGVLEERGVSRFLYDVDTAIICFRGSKASKQLIERFNGSRLKETILYHPQLCYSSEFHVLIVPEMMWGGPVTAIVVEELFALGVQTLIGFGAGGSIDPEVLPGSMFIARKAICCDGTSREYSDKGECTPDPQLLDYYANRREELGFLFLNGLTTDSLYSETPRKIENWRRLGADFINLEISPFYTVPSVLGMRAIYIGLITDYVGEKWKSIFWGVDNEVDIKIIESIKGLCMKNRLY